MNFHKVNSPMTVAIKSE